MGTAEGPGGPRSSVLAAGQCRRGLTRAGQALGSQTGAADAAVGTWPGAGVSSRAELWAVGQISTKQDLGARLPLGEDRVGRTIAIVSLSRLRSLSSDCVPSKAPGVFMNIT